VTGGDDQPETDLRAKGAPARKRNEREGIGGERDTKPVREKSESNPNNQYRLFWIEEREGMREPS